MTTRRDEILNATSRAAELLEQFPTDNRTSFDVVGAVTELEIPLMYRPLKGLWGATITVDDDEKGVLVTTKLGRAVQRFTLAHELGHVLLGHKESFDETVGFTGRFGPKAKPTEEIAADTFASELLAPKRLAVASAKRHGWDRKALTDPTNVYQLSLRLGISFQAACWALVSHGVFDQSHAEQLQKLPVKDTKLKIASPTMINDSWADVWRITEGDNGTFLEGGINDVFAVHLQDFASAGYIWELVDVGNGAEVLDEVLPIEKKFSQPAARVVFLRFKEQRVHRLTLEHRRPWNKQKLAQIDINISNFGKEIEGFSRQFREQALAVSA